MNIEKMTAETVEAVAKLEEACFSTPWSHKDLVSELENPWAIWPGRCRYYVHRHISGFSRKRRGKTAAE